MRFLTTCLLCLAIGLACTPDAMAFGHHKSPEKKVQKDIKKGTKKMAKLDRPKLLHHHK